MFNNNFKKLIANSKEELAIKTDSHRNMWQFGEEIRWDIDQNEWTIKLTFQDKVVIAPVQIIGTINKKDNTWLWAWANSTIDKKAAEHSLKLKEYGEQIKEKKLITPKWKASEDDGWEMVALAVKYCNAQCGYRGIVDNLMIFMSFGKISISTK